MDSKTAIKEIEENFEDIAPGADETTIRIAVTGVIRAVSRLQRTNRDIGTRCARIASDLMSMYNNAIAYSKLKNKSENPGINVRPEFDETFFQSVAILKNELFILLKKI